MVQCFTEPLYNNLKTELLWKQMHNTVTIMFSPYYYSSNAIFLIKKNKKIDKERKRRSETLTLVFTVKKYNQLQ
jgi:hypothetical protein